MHYNRKVEICIYIETVTSAEAVSNIMANGRKEDFPVPIKIHKRFFHNFQSASSETFKQLSVKKSLWFEYVLCSNFVLILAIYRLEDYGILLQHENSRYLLFSLVNMPAVLW